MTKKIALISGVTGQDGAYLSQFLLKKNYEVHGIKRRSSSFNTGRLENIYEEIKTKPKVTRPKFNPFSLTAKGDIINPIIAGTIPAKGNQINISSSYPLTKELPTPPRTADTYVPVPMNAPCAKLIWPAKPETILRPHAATAVNKAVVIKYIQYCEKKNEEIMRTVKPINAQTFCVVVFKIAISFL